MPTKGENFPFRPTSKPPVSAPNAQVEGDIVDFSPPIASGSAVDASHLGRAAATGRSSTASEGHFRHGGADEGAAAGTAAPTGHFNGGDEGRRHHHPGFSFPETGSGSGAAAPTAGHFRGGHREHDHHGFDVSFPTPDSFAGGARPTGGSFRGFGDGARHHGEGRASGSQEAGPAFSFGGSGSAHESGAAGEGSKHHHPHHHHRESSQGFGPVPTSGASGAATFSALPSVVTGSFDPFTAGPTSTSSAI